MHLLIILGIVAVIVFIFALLSGRRFGILALGLAAGYILNNLWAEQLAGFLDRMGFASELGSSALLGLGITLFAPMVILLFGGPKYSHKSSRLISAIMIAILSIVFLVEPLVALVAMDDAAISIYSLLVGYLPYAITFGLILGVLDIALTRASKKSD